MKDIYTFDSLGITQPVIETEMEARMVEKIKYVMLEMGYGFSFIGNQYRIHQNNKDYYIDLLFYNRRLQALTAFEIKSGAFKPEYAGKMNFYLNLLDDFVREPHEINAAIVNIATTAAVLDRDRKSSLAASQHTLCPAPLTQAQPAAASSAHEINAEERKSATPT